MHREVVLVRCAFAMYLAAVYLDLLLKEKLVHQLSVSGKGMGAKSDAFRLLMQKTKRSLLGLATVQSAKCSTTCHS